MPRKPTLNAPLMNVPFAAGFGSIPEYQMPGFVRRNEVSLHLVLKGQVQVLVSTGQSFMIIPGHLAISWGAIPHRANFLAPVNQLLSISFPLAWFLSWNLPPAFTSAVMAGRTLFEPNPARLATDEPLLTRWSKDVPYGKTPSPEVRRVVLLELEARVNRLALDIDPATPFQPHPSSEAPDTVQKMITFIAQNAGQPIAVTQVAESVNLHSDYASRLFQRATGTGLLDFINQHRVASAQGLLACTDAKIADIAHAAGFGSVSQFHAVFERYAKTTPGKYRKAARKGG
jgi:AraC family transcriptional regulator, melibiose operon regulatory protein